MTLQMFRKCVFHVCSALVAASVLVVVVKAEQAHVDTSAGDASSSGFDEALREQMYGEAEIIAKTELAQALENGRRDELSTASLYTNLADAQRLGGDPEASQTNYEIAISIIQAGTDMLNLALERPLYGLAMAALDNDRPDIAIRHFDRAVHVRQVNDGPHNIAQVDQLDMLARAYFRLGDTEQAAAVAKRIDFLLDRHIESSDTDIRARLLTQGDLYGVIGYRDMERKAYALAISVVNDRDDSAQSLLVEPYIRIGESFFAEYFDDYFSATEQDELPDEQLLADGKANLEKANTLALDHAGPDWRLRNRALLALGDFYTATDNFSKARQVYRECWELLTADQSRLRQRERDLESVTPLLQPLPEFAGSKQGPRASHEKNEDSSEGQITMTFTVNRRGRLTDIGLVEILPGRNPEIEARMKQSLGNFVYRPRMKDGFIVDTHIQAFRYEFPSPVTAEED